MPDFPVWFGPQQNILKTTDAIVSAVRVTGADGQLPASETATMARLRETVRDARTRPFRPVRVGEVRFFNVDHTEFATTRAA